MVGFFLYTVLLLSFLLVLLSQKINKKHNNNNNTKKYINTDFISRNDGEHVRGTECDQTILSRKGSSGVVYSPNYPFPYIPGIICRYFIYGLQDAQHFERVKIEFEKFDIPTTDYT